MAAGSGWLQVLALAGWPLGHSQVFFFPSTSESIHKCHCNLSASCLWHLSLFRDALKHRAALCPPWRGRGVEKMGLCSWLARQPSNTEFPEGREERDANSSLPLVVRSSVISTNLPQTGVSANLLNSPENRTNANCRCCGSPHLQLWFSRACWRMVCVIS